MLMLMIGVEGEGSHVQRVSVSFDSQLTSLVDATQASDPLNFCDNCYIRVPSYREIALRYFHQGVAVLNKINYF